MADVQKTYVKVIRGQGFLFSGFAAITGCARVSPGSYIRQPPNLPASRCVASHQYSAGGEGCKAISSMSASGYNKGVRIEIRRLTREPLLHHRVLVGGRR